MFRNKFRICLSQQFYVREISKQKKLTNDNNSIQDVNEAVFAEINLPVCRLQTIS